jgi:threonine dehydratase
MDFQTQVEQSWLNMTDVVELTPLQYSETLSEKYNCNLYIKREDKQKVRSFKIRGAFNKIISLNDDERKRGVVCASAGNHAQGFALSCQRLQIKGVIFLPITTPKQKIRRIEYFSKEWCKLKIFGNNLGETLDSALEFCENNNMTFVHPFDDEKTIIGQATICHEIMSQFDTDKRIDYIICPVGGGGLISGIAKYCKLVSPETKIIGVEPIQCPSMTRALEDGGQVFVDCKDMFVDGATVNKIGKLNYEIVKDNVDDIKLVCNGRLCCEIVDLYQNEGLLCEPAGALSLSVLDQIDINGKNVICILSGSNNDLMRYPDIVNKAMIYKNLRHYFIIKFIQKPGQLKDFVCKILGPNDDIIRFEYFKKTNNNFGNVLVGVEVINPSDVGGIYERLAENGFECQKINENDQLFEFLV